MVNTQRSLRVFLCHSSSDKQTIRNLHRRLRTDNIDPWLDENKLLPGQDWDLEITKAVQASDVVIVCLSPNSITKAGYVQKEIRHALNVADEQPEGAIFIIPLKLEECEMPSRLRRWQWVNYFEKGGYKQLISALRHCASILSLAPVATKRRKSIKLARSKDTSDSLALTKTIEDPKSVRELLGYLNVYDEISLTLDSRYEVYGDKDHLDDAIEKGLANVYIPPLGATVMFEDLNGKERQVLLIQNWKDS